MFFFSVFSELVIFRFFGNRMEGGVMLLGNGRVRGWGSFILG